MPWLVLLSERSCTSKASAISQKNRPMRLCQEHTFEESGMQSIRSIWERIETQLKIEASFEKMHPSEALRDFQVGATEEEIQVAEAALDSAFPEEVKASYRIHNGRMGIGGPDQMIRRLCSLQEVVETWRMMKPYANGRKENITDDWFTWNGQPILVRVETWNIKWIPLLNSDGTLVCLDLAPTPHGHMGQ